MRTLEDFWSAPRTPLPELRPVDKMFTVTLMRQDTHAMATWPFRTKAEATSFVGWADITTGLCVIEFNFNPVKEEHTHGSEEDPVTRPHPG